MRRDHILDAMRIELKRHGLDRYRVRRGSNHNRLTVDVGDGGVVIVTYAKTPSDRRAVMNSVAVLRRLLKRRAV